MLTAAFAASMIQFSSAADMVNEREVGTQVVPPPGPVQNGALVDRCGGWALATPGMTCYALAQSLGVDLVTFTLLNPQLEKDCVHNFWGGYYYCAGLAQDHSMLTQAPPPPKKSPHYDCNGAADDQCASAVFAASETPGPMVDWCKRYLGGPTCTERRPEGIFSSYDGFPKQAMASSLCAYPSAPPMAPRFSTACQCFTQMYPQPT
ncbi:hypothetical protein F4823DRAFT_640549 [Ustulina deusta]|nr:hypothetical protein F4823DRAFT_640549 [Ustulina deusta]